MEQLYVRKESRKNVKKDLLGSWPDRRMCTRLWCAYDADGSWGDITKQLQIKQMIWFVSTSVRCRQYRYIAMLTTSYCELLNGHLLLHSIFVSLQFGTLGWLYTYADAILKRQF